jgi:putative transposase
MARSTFYYHLAQSKKADKYQVVKDKIAAIYHLNKGRYGYRRITLVLRQDGLVINHKTIYRLMKQDKIKCMVRLKKYHSYKADTNEFVPNLLQRNFKAEAPYQKLVTDVTEFSLCGKKLFLSPVMDLYNSEIIGYAIQDHPTLQLVTNMLESVFKKIPDYVNIILHSDQGWQYHNPSYKQFLIKKGVVQSMSRKGNCLDNAAMENFFGILKTELLYLQKFSSMKEFESELKKYIEYYNNDRIKIKLKGLSPVCFRTQSFPIT